jgi:hypothetical protein
VRVRLGDRWGAEGRGRSKRLAEREAARLTLIERDESEAGTATPPAGLPVSGAAVPGADGVR